MGNSKENDKIVCTKMNIELLLVYYKVEIMGNSKENDQIVCTTVFSPLLGPRVPEGAIKTG